MTQEYYYQRNGSKLYLNYLNVTYSIDFHGPTIQIKLIAYVTSRHYTIDVMSYMKAIHLIETVFSAAKKLCSGCRSIVIGNTKSSVEVSLRDEFNECTLRFINSNPEYILAEDDNTLEIINEFVDNIMYLYAYKNPDMDKQSK